MTFSTALFRTGLCTGLLVLFVHAAQAQDPGSGGPTPGAPEPTAVPIDGGASLLLAGGALYALKRLRKR
ncbi:PID-CTERM protein-sorting domain-containing protein [Hymenobacter jeollabukensis]|uniref:VPDSG-CTERM sorting domain-containing protein n=1 Tax=Hymenobacter jeollabukensis TaxID=2025313 RepID=A0A5R8WWI4_9BACT|nr:hypothetical protein [Hymenobacter jeollabukensis]TLM96897.1 hypothetical protein FDY95_02575 [Hymenobacter jeollabukensis]